jgi:hypothetical protein
MMVKPTTVNSQSVLGFSRREKNMGFLSSIFGATTPVQGSTAKTGTKVKNDGLDGGSENLLEGKLSSPFEENPAKARRRRPRGLSFAERDWTRE